MVFTNFYYRLEEGKKKQNDGSISKAESFCEKLKNELEGYRTELETFKNAFTGRKQFDKWDPLQDIGNLNDSEAQPNFDMLIEHPAFNKIWDTIKLFSQAKTKLEHEMEQMKAQLENKPERPKKRDWNIKELKKSSSWYNSLRVKHHKPRGPY